MSAASRLATMLMRWGSRQSRFGSQTCYTPSYVKSAVNEISVATQAEFEDGDSFFQRFESKLLPVDLRDKEVLDIGCGHGGRTAYYVLHGKPKSMTGLEISYERVRVAQTSAPRLSPADRLFFVAAFGEELPFADNSFDMILSYDVFEHVQNLPQVLQECHRVLRPGGKIYALFPPYYGPRAHHLDFVTSLPFLHYLFSPKVLVESVNQILQEQPELRDAPLPLPTRSYLDKEVLPRLNGTTERDFHRLIAELPFRLAEIELLPFAWEDGGALKKSVRQFCRGMLKMPVPFTRDIFVSSIRCMLQK